MSLFHFPLGAAALARICEQKCRRLHWIDEPRHASAEIDWSGRISKCGDAMLRSYLFEAAGVLLTRVPKWQRNQSEGTAIIR